jgi:excisionase family DNA binding protein
MRNLKKHDDTDEADHQREASRGAPLTVKEASERLRLSVSKTYELVAQKRIAHYRDGNGPIRFSEEHIQEYLASIEHGRGEKWPVEKSEHRLKHVRL